MAVQKSRKSRSRRGMKRAQKLQRPLPALSIDSLTGETHRRHHVTKSGHYRGKKVVNFGTQATSDDAKDSNED